MWKLFSSLLDGNVIFFAVASSTHRNRRWAKLCSPQYFQKNPNRMGTKLCPIICTLYAGLQPHQLLLDSSMFRWGKSGVTVYESTEDAIIWFLAFIFFSSIHILDHHAHLISALLLLPIVRTLIRLDAGGEILYPPSDLHASQETIQSECVLTTYTPFVLSHTPRNETDPRTYYRHTLQKYPRRILKGLLLRCS